jgi:hypothetical protein
MGKVYILPKKQQAPTEALKPVSNCPQSDLYTIIKSASGVFHVVNRSALSGSPTVVHYTAAKKDWAIDWVLLNDPQKESA